MAGKCSVIVAGLLVLALTGLPTTSEAHDARPLVVEINQSSNFAAVIDYRLPDSVDSRFGPTATLPAICQKSSELIGPAVGSGSSYRHGFDCTGPLAGEKLTIDFPVVNPSLSTVLTVTLPDGAGFTTVLPPGTTHWFVPGSASVTTIAGDYGLLGITHIWKGLDHLLFIVCLLFIAMTPKRILTAITGFTLAHSVTLAIAALGVIQLSIPAIEAVIALSIVCLAAEILRNDRSSIAWRRPILVASMFGALHGLGFASALTEIGLPRLHNIQALIFFNLGVETGQIAFIGVTLFVVTLVNRSIAVMTVSGIAPKLRTATLYMIGTLGAFWFMTRSVISLG